MLVFRMTEVGRKIAWILFQGDKRLSFLFFTYYSPFLVLTNIIINNIL